MNLDGSDSREFVTSLGTNTLIGMTIDTNDNIYVADRSGGKIKKIAPDASVTDFITGLTTPTWVTLGGDGYFYISLGSRKIEKYDISGEKVGEFLTPPTLGYPWGTNIDETGCIYFQTMGSTSSKIIGTGDINDKNIINLTLNTSLYQSSLDPDAFTVSGVTSNPKVTQAVYSESGVCLTLDNEISYMDINPKVSYIKTGANNMSTSSAAIELDNFTNLPVNNNLLKVTNISPVSNINVNYGTDLTTVKAKLPDTLPIALNDATTISAAITWDSGTPEYNGDIAGNYIFNGRIDIPRNVSNSSNLSASVSVIVDQVALSNDATLLGIRLSSGTLTPEFNSGTTSYSVSVPNNVSSLSVTPILSDKKAKVSVNGTPIALNEGSNEINVKVTAEDGVTIQTYKINVQRQRQDGGGTGGGYQETPKLSENTIKVIVNGQEQNAGKETKTTVSGQTIVTVEVDNKIIRSKIDEVIKTNTAGAKNVIQVPISDKNSEIAKVELTGDIIKELEDNIFDVSVKRDNVEYIIPAEELAISKIAEKLGVLEKDLKDIKIEVQVNKLDKTLVAKYYEIAKANGAELVFPPTGFEVVAKTINKDKTTAKADISKFSDFVERVMEIPTGIDPSKFTTGIVFNDDGTYSHVPTGVFQKDGKWYARLNSLTNSNYSVIWNPITVKSVENHWAEDTINDMASRLVIFNADTFEPNKAIKRADFAEYIVRALGIYREE